MPSLKRSRPAAGVELLRLDRPDVRNALDTASLIELLAAIADIAEDPEIKVLVVSTTSTVALCAGADVGEQLDHEGGVRRMDLFCDLYREFEALPMPTVAVCVGNVLGAGTELAATCDLRVGGDNLKMGWVAARLGVPVGPARLVPLVGLARAKELAFTTRVIDVDEALALGLVTEVVPADEAEAAAVALAERVAQNKGIRTTKQIFRGLERSQDRVEFENELLASFQREGAGLPKG